MASQTSGRRLIRKLIPPRAPRGTVQDGRITRPVHIIASPFKTGTTSVGEALLELGVGSYAMPYTGDLLDRFADVIKPLNALALERQGFRKFESDHGERVRADLADLVKKVAPYDVFPDAPFGHTHLHPFVRKALAPEARFIWVNRDRRDWLSSVENWETSHPEIYPAHTDWTERPKRRRSIMRSRWRVEYTQFKRLRRVFPDHCLELEWSDLGDFTALAAFYDMPVPDRAFPRSNVSREASDAETVTGGAGD